MGNRRKRIGVFGGSFNPIHHGHIGVADALLKTGFVDEILFVVSPHNPLKQKEDLWDDALRLRLVEEALADYPQMTACDVEFSLPQPSYMWTTLETLSGMYADCEIVLLMGADNWLCFDRWYKSGDILQSYEIGIYPRPGYEVDKAGLPANVHFLNTPLIDISSTQIREKLFSVH